MQPSIKLVEVSSLHKGCGNPTVWPSGLVRCLLVESGNGLLLVEVGAGNLDYISRYRRLGLLHAARLYRDCSRTLRSLLFAGGYRPDDVTDIVVSHLHPHHSGGLFDFPRARVHALPSVAESAKPHLSRLLPDPSQLVIARQAAHPFHGLRTTAIQFGAMPLNLVEFSPSLPHLQGVLLAHEGGSLLHVGTTLSSLDELTGAPPLTASVRSVLGQARPFSLQRLRQRLRALYRSDEQVTFVASFGAVRTKARLAGLELPILGEIPTDSLPIGVPAGG